MNRLFKQKQKKCHLVNCNQTVLDRIFKVFAAPYRPKKASKYLFITELSITKNPVWVHLGVVLHALVVTPGEVEEVVVSLHRFLSSFPKTCRRERRRRRVLTKISSFWAEGGEEGGSNFGPKHYLASRADGSALDGLGQVF